MLAEADKRKERSQLTLKANLTDESVHGDGSLSAAGIAILSHPAKAKLMPNSASSLNQRRGIHVEILAAMEVTQEADAAEQIPDEVFKRQVVCPLSIDFDAGGCEKF